MRSFIMGMLVGLSLSGAGVWAWSSQDELNKTLQQMRTLQQLEYNQRYLQQQREQWDRALGYHPC